ncbi:phosphate ABC transporter ATP-binding protein PstB [Haliscomenobacter sp.]|uniref:phosphate ABC transporter ATP-binding protein PstB n=1 Tax=Haliscomenobacter sp. TaxID=2717303 RepID=UPI003BAC0DAA
MKTKLAVRNLHLHYGAKEVLKGINLDVPENNIVALIGPSGCGKSTLLRAMNRMHDLNPETKVKGQILLDDDDIYAPGKDVVAVRRKIGMVFQKPNPFPKSIFDNIAYGLKLAGENDKKKLHTILERTLRSSYLWEEVKDDLDKSALSLSGGQQQRLCIARAVAVEPEVLLMDEPCSALDPISTAKIEGLMLELKKEYTIVIVTHNMQQAQRVADLTAFMYFGEVIEYAPTEELFRDPKVELTANYLSGNFG